MLKIDVTETFQHLACPHCRGGDRNPHARGVSVGGIRPRDQLKARLPGYPKISSQNEFRHELKVKEGPTPEQLFHDLGWRDGDFNLRTVVTLLNSTGDGFVFSRLQPYESWNQFKEEAIRLWNVHAELAKSVEVQRLGVRFINRITLPVGEVRLADYLRVPPNRQREPDLQITGFFHKDSLWVPGHPYAVNIVKTVQPPHGPDSTAAR